MEPHVEVPTGGPQASGECVPPWAQCGPRAGSPHHSSQERCPQTTVSVKRGQRSTGHHPQGQGQLSRPWEARHLSGPPGKQHLPAAAQFRSAYIETVRVCNVGNRDCPHHGPETVEKHLFNSRSTQQGLWKQPGNCPWACSQRLGSAACGCRRQLGPWSLTGCLVLRRPREHAACTALDSGEAELRCRPLRISGQGNSGNTHLLMATPAARARLGDAQS